MHYNCGYDFEVEEFARRGYEPYPTREKSKEDLILEKLDMIVNLLNEQNSINQEIGKFMEATRKISNITEERISKLENKVNEVEVENNEHYANLEASTNERLSKELMLDTLGLRKEEGKLAWFDRNEWKSLMKN